MTGGYVGKILRVELDKGTCKDENLPRKDVLRKFLGGTGLGVYYLYDEVPPGIKPLAPECPLIIMTGPLTGLTVPGSSDWTVINFHPETTKTVGTAHGHGFFGPFLKFAGYDGIIIKGKSEKPVYLWIKDGKAELRDASHIWGKDTHEAEDLVREEVGIKEAKVAAIGPAGENLIAGSIIESDKHHHAAKGGCGAVMGSKNLKAIAVYGKGGIAVADGKRLFEVAQKWRDSLFTPYGMGTMMGKAGVTRMYGMMAQHSMISAKNYSSPECGSEMGRRIDEAVSSGKIKITTAPCFGCPIGCSYKAEITYGPYKGKVATLSGGGENLETSSAMVGITEPAAVYYMADLYDHLGIDSAAGLAMSLAFECYEKGIITTRDTDGLELRWGDVEVVQTLLDKIIKREGFGAVLADGPYKAAERIGGDAKKFAVHIKGTGIHTHDWRSGAWSIILGLAVAGAGPRFEGMGVDAFGIPEPDLGYYQPGTPLVKEGKAEAVKKTAMKKLWYDSLGVCMFNVMAVPGSLQFFSEALMAATGWERFTPEEGLLLGERITNLQRVFNVRQGLTPVNDLDVGERLLEAPTEGIAKGIPLAPHFHDMVMEYYELEGWDKETGKPLKETLRRVGLEEYIGDIW